MIELVRSCQINYERIISLQKAKDIIFIYVFSLLYLYYDTLL